MLPVVSVSWQRSALMTVETHHNIFERWCALTMKGEIYILPGTPFYVYIAKLTARPIILLTLMIGSFASNSPKCIRQAREDELRSKTDGGPILTQSNKFISYLTVDAVQR